MLPSLFDASEIAAPLFFIVTIVSAHWCLPPTLLAAAYCDNLPPAKWKDEQLLAEPKPIFCLDQLEMVPVKVRAAVNDMY